MGYFSNFRAVLFTSLFLAASGASAFAQKAYDTGATDTEIKIGNIMAYSGPASAYGAIGKAQTAYFNMINEQGGINGRKINFISYDDAYSPPKTVEQARKLVESDEVLLTFGILGTPGNSAVQKYLNAKKVPQLFSASGAARFTDPKSFPWTMAFNPNYFVEGRIYARFILKEYPNAKIGIFYQNDDLGKDYLNGIKSGLGGKAAGMIVAEAPYEVSDATIDAQILKLKNAGANLFFSASTPKMAAMAIRKIAELGWHPVHILDINATSVGAVLKPAGSDASTGVISVNYTKDPLDPTWKDDTGMKRYLSFMARYYPEGDKDSNFNSYGYTTAQLLVQVLKQCGDNLTRENVMRQASSLRDISLDLALPGVKVNTSPTDYRVVKQLQMMKFNGERWELFGSILDDSDTQSPSNARPQPVPPPIVALAPPPPPPAVVPPPPAVTPPPPAVIAVPPPKPATVVAPPPSNFAASTDFGTRVALVIGNSTYKDAPALPNPTRDAKAVAQMLTKLGFQTVTLQTDLGREKMLDALRNFARQAQSADWALVYFAGHGMEVGGVNYLIPVDAVIESDQDMTFAAIPLEQVLNTTDRARKLRLVILDACRSNPYANRMKRTAEVSSRSVVTRGFARIEPSGTLVVYAAKDGQTASDGDGSNSPFTTALLKNLATPNIEVRRMFDNVRDDVQELTRGQQLPFTYGSVSGRQDFYFTR
jgi:branched-chain amino acid transport system substrate-binding protein